MNGKDGNNNDAPEQFKQYAHGTLVHQGTGIGTTVEALNNHNDDKEYLANVDRYNDRGERDDNGMYDEGGNRLQIGASLLPMNPLGDFATDHTDGIQPLTDVDGKPMNQEGSAGAVLTHVIDSNGATGTEPRTTADIDGHHGSLLDAAGRADAGLDHRTDQEREEDRLRAEAAGRDNDGPHEDGPHDGPEEVEVHEGGEDGPAPKTDEEIAADAARDAE
jgi:hypothetical protein